MGSPPLVEAKSFILEEVGYVLLNEVGPPSLLMMGFLTGLCTSIAIPST